MLRLSVTDSSRLCRKLYGWCLASQVQALCSESADSDVIPHSQPRKPLRRRRAWSRIRAISADIDTDMMDMNENSMTDTFHRRAADRRHRIPQTSTSADSLQSQLDNAAVQLPETDLEFPSDVPEGSEGLHRRDQARHAYRPKINPMDTSVVLFPGQGSHFVGMGAKLLAYPGVEKLYKRASNILGYNVLDMCLHGPPDELSRTVHCQPAVLVTSIAAVQKLKEICPKAVENCISVAGYDVGEYAALVFAGAMSFEDAVRVVKIRASAMQSASHLISSGMIRIHFGASGKISKACHFAKLYCHQELDMMDAVCDITSYLYPGCKVISGHTEALEFITKHRREFGIKTVEHLPVPGAFHSRLMHSTVAALTRALSAVELHDPIVPVFANTTSKKYLTVASIRQQLVDQMYRAVRWEQLMHVLYSRPVGGEFPKTFEVGPGRQLGSLLQRVNDKAYQQYDCIEV